jgi:hypothetical protein
VAHFPSFSFSELLSPSLSPSPLPTFTAPPLSSLSRSEQATMRFTSFFLSFELTKEELFIVLGFGYLYILLLNWKWARPNEPKCEGHMICQE